MNLPCATILCLVVLVNTCSSVQDKTRSGQSPDSDTPLFIPESHTHTTHTSPQRCTCVPHNQCNIRSGQDNQLDLTESLTVSDDCDDGQVCCYSEANEGSLNQPKCGYRPMEKLVLAMARFATEGQALYGEFPWMVAVLGQQYVKEVYQTAAYYCGGSLIRPDVVLTAAHCVKGKKSLTIRAGEWSVTNLEPLPVQNINVVNVTIHEEYFPEKMHNDIALLFLESSVELTPSVATVCLPSQGESFDNQTCVASGWGKDNFGEKGQYQDILKKVEMSVVPQGQCEESLQSTRLGSDFQLHESFLCAGGMNKRDMCQGDGGSPLVCPVEGGTSYVQAGVVSWGMGCGGESPGAYVNVANFRDWIDHKLALTVLQH